MKNETIIPCICRDHDPTVADSVYYGMPILRVNNTLVGSEYCAVCPNCGRGGGIASKIAGQAIKEWNKMQIFLKQEEERTGF